MKFSTYEIVRLIEDKERNDTWPNEKQYSLYFNIKSDSLSGSFSSTKSAKAKKHWIEKWTVLCFIHLLTGHA